MSHEFDALLVPYCSLPTLLRDVRHKCQLSCAFDGRLKFPLMHRAGSRNPSRQDLAALGHERAQQLYVLVINVINLVRAELADLPTTKQCAALSILFVPAARGAPSAPRARSPSCFSHDYTSAPSKPASSVSSTRGPSPGCRSGGRPRATRRRSETVFRRVRVRSTTRFSRSMRTIKWRRT